MVTESVKLERWALKVVKSTAAEEQAMAGRYRPQLAIPRAQPRYEQRCRRRAGVRMVAAAKNGEQGHGSGHTGRRLAGGCDGQRALLGRERHHHERGTDIGTIMAAILAWSPGGLGCDSCRRSGPCPSSRWRFVERFDMVEEEVLYFQFNCWQRCVSYVQLMYSGADEDAQSSSLHLELGCASDIRAWALGEEQALAGAVIRASHASPSLPRHWLFP